MEAKLLIDFQKKETMQAIINSTKEAISKINREKESLNSKR
jgi:hypothetical protein